MSGTYYIDAVRLDSTHYHIDYVHLTNGQTISRTDVIHNITWYRTTFLTYAPNVPLAKVIVANCPRCGTGDYITTEPDDTESNNLLDLPRF